MAKRMAVNTKNKTSRSKKTKKRLAIKNARIANRKRKNLQYQIKNHSKRSDF